MTVQQKKVLKTLVERFKARLGLHHYAIRIGVCDDPQWQKKGEAEGIYGRFVAIVTLADGMAFDEMRETLCHEMLHIRLWQTFAGADRVKKIAGKKAFRVWESAWRENHEYEVDALAMALAANFDDDDLREKWGA